VRQGDSVESTSKGKDDEFCWQLIVGAPECRFMVPVTEEPTCALPLTVALALHPQPDLRHNRVAMWLIQKTHFFKQE